MAVEKVMLIVVPAIGVEPSAGEVVTTCGIASQVPELQTSPLPQGVLLGSSDHAVVEVDGAQTWHAFDGFTVPDG
jgi:hypothetical protein